MAKFKPGQSGNPKGRPPKERALTPLLERAGSKTVEYIGRRVAGKRVLATMIWEGLLTVIVTLPTGRKLTLSPTDWKDFVKWMYRQVDGPPPTNLDLTTGGEPLQQKNVIRVIVHADEDKEEAGSDSA